MKKNQLHEYSEHQRWKSSQSSDDYQPDVDSLIFEGKGRKNSVNIKLSSPTTSHAMPIITVSGFGVLTCLHFLKIEVLILFFPIASSSITLKLHFKSSGISDFTEPTNEGLDEMVQWIHVRMQTRSTQPLFV